MHSRVFILLIYFYSYGKIFSLHSLKTVFKVCPQYLGHKKSRDPFRPFESEISKDKFQRLKLKTKNQNFNLCKILTTLFWREKYFLLGVFFPLKSYKVLWVFADTGEYKTYYEQIAGGGWKLVRRVGRGENWHPASDQLQGNDTYGTFFDNPTLSRTFSR